MELKVRTGWNSILNNACCDSPGFGGRVLLLAALWLSVTGCMLGPKYKTPDVKTAEQWRELGSPQYVGQPVDEIEWWKGLNDPVLDGLIQQAFDQNLSLQAASLRIVQARLGRTTAAYLFLPFVTGSGSISHSNFSTNVQPEVQIDRKERSPREPRRTGPVREALRNEIAQQLADGIPSISVAPELELYDAGFDAIWELDLWGKRRQNFRAAGEQVNAAYAAYDAMMVALAAEVARTYIQVRTLEQRITAMNELLITMRRFESLAQARYDAGETLITDVKLAKLQVGAIESALPSLETGRRQLENSLCVLLGRAPQSLADDLGTTGPIPSVPIETVVGIPADLLRRRPDVRMAEHLAAAQCARVGMAKAAILPSFNIFGAIGLSSSDSDNFFESDSVRGAYGGLLKVTTLINYPVTVQKVRNEDAQFQEALLAYRETVLRANMEVEDAMFALLRARDEATILEGNVTEALETVNLTLSAYQDGKVIVSIPLSALTFLASQQDQMWVTRGASATDYVAVYKALGGGWQNRVGRELVPEYIQEQMRKQADWWSFSGKHDMRTVQLRK